MTTEEMIERIEKLEGSSFILSCYNIGGGGSIKWYQEWQLIYDDFAVEKFRYREMKFGEHRNDWIGPMSKYKASLILDEAQKRIDNNFVSSYYNV